jgi:hypothetical protein
MADLFTPNLTPAVAANNDPPAGANREYLDVVFGCKVNVVGIKLQGMPPIDIGRDTNDPLNFKTVYGIP